MYRLRRYQEEAISALDTQFIKHRSTLVQMATGLGKTVMFAHVADLWPGRVLVIAHRDELIRQAAEKIHAVTGHPAGIEMGRERASDSLYGTKVTVGSVQTLSRANRRARFHPDHFSLVIVDEGHHAVAQSYREVLDYFKSAKVLFVTATPKRGDQVALGSVCQSVAYEYGIKPAIDDGWLVPVRQIVVKVDDLDFSKARTVAEDFNQSDLEKILTEEKPLHEMCASAHEIAGDRQALWFCVTRAHASATAGVLSRYAKGGVEYLSGDTPREDRHRVVADYKAGRIQHLCNCALFLEGFDAPATSAIVMARPTKSLGLYEQILGRGTRPLGGVVDGIAGPGERRQAIAMSLKPDMVVIDFAGNAGRHQIVQATDVLGGKHDAATRAYAKQTMENEERTAVDIDEALDRAQEELVLLAEQAERRKQITAQAVYRTHEVDPFTKQYASANGHPQKTPKEPCTDKTAWLIHYLSKKAWTFAEAKRLSQRQAGAIITNLKNMADR